MKLLNFASGVMTGTMCADLVVGATAYSSPPVLQLLVAAAFGVVSFLNLVEAFR